MNDTAWPFPKTDCFNCRFASSKEGCKCGRCDEQCGPCPHEKDKYLKDRTLDEFILKDD